MMSVLKKKKVGRPIDVELKKRKEEALLRKDSVKKRFLVIVKSEVSKALIERKLMQNHISPFIKKVFTTVDPGAVYKHNWHIDLISEYLEAVWLGQYQKIIFNMPPRFMKSITITIALPAWGLGKRPEEQFMCGSYSAQLSLKHSVYCRTVMESDWYHATFPDTNIRKDQNEKSQYMTTKMGFRLATSVGGSATGDGGNFRILDDPMNPKEASSDKERVSVNDWIDQTWSTRGNDPKTCVDIVVMQRLHVNDTTGHLLAHGGYKHVVIPQEAEKKTIIIMPISKTKIIREDGELLHEERFGEKEKKAAQANLGTYGYAGQHQQRPVPLEGGRIKLSDFPRFKQQPIEFDEMVLSADTAQKEKEINDPSVILVFGRVGVKWYLIHLWKMRARYPILKSSCVSLANKFKPDAFLIEDKSSGSSLIQDLQDHTSIPVVAIEPEADKITRMDTQTPSIEAGLISLPDPLYNPEAGWLSYLEECLMHFPQPNSWDELDALSQFIKWTKTKKNKIEIW